MSQQRRLSILSLSPWESFWSMGFGMGAPDDFKVTQAFVRNGHRVIHLVPSASGLPPDPEIEGIVVVPYPRPQSLHIRRFPFDRFGALRNWLVLNLRLALSGAACVRRCPTDAILGHSAETALAAFVLGRIFRVPSILHLY